MTTNYMSGLECPACKKSTGLEVLSSVLVELTPDNLQLLTDEFVLFENAPTMCSDCGHSGLYGEFVIDDQHLTHPKRTYHAGQLTH